MKRSVILTDRFGPNILLVLRVKGQVLQRERAHLKVPGCSLVLSALITKKLPKFLSRLNEISGDNLKLLRTRPSVRVHWVACGTCTVPDNFFQVGRSLRSHTRRGPLAHRSSHVRTTKQTCPCVICSSNSARYCFGIVYHCSAMVEVLCK